MGIHVRSLPLLVDQKDRNVTGGFDGPEYCQPGNEYLLPLPGNTARNMPQSTGWPSS